MSMNTRRDALKKLGIISGLGLTSTGILGDVNDKKELNYDTNHPWEYHNLDPQKTAELAYQLYKKGHCMYAVFGSILVSLAEQYGEPYASFPLNMTIYGAGGILGYGSLCGTLNGASAAIGLFASLEKPRGDLVHELLTWYEKTNLPVFGPETSKTDFNIIPTVSESVLCHISLAKWHKENNYKMYSEQRVERCKRLSADVAKKTVELLNERIREKPQPVSDDNFKGLSEEVKTCLSCHTNSPQEAKLKIGRMNCYSCHDNPKTGTIAHPDNVGN